VEDHLDDDQDLDDALKGNHEGKKSTTKPEENESELFSELEKKKPTASTEQPTSQITTPSRESNFTRYSRYQPRPTVTDLEITDDVDEHESEGDCSPSMDMYSRVLK
jgi:hypothetical protein